MTTDLQSNFSPSPVVLIPSCNRLVGDHPSFTTGKKYIDAVRLAGCTPLIIPTDPSVDPREWLHLADGLLLTGSPSNVHPNHFGQDVHNPALPLDPARDAVTLPLVREALHQGIPLFAICRGLQEVNVAMGGSLHQAVQELPNQMDHREDERLTLEEQYSFAHPIRVVADSFLESILGVQTLEVNSLHGQGIDRLGPGLVAQAYAPDGLIEAFTAPEMPGFNLSVQWHPEWQAAKNPYSVKLFKAFGQACMNYRNQHHPSLL